MATFVALVRAVNVGGRNQLAMAELRALFESFGYANVASYIQSGNIIFDTSSSKSAALASVVEESLTEALGQPIDVVIRSARELRSVLESNPFVGRVPDPKKLHVVFLNHEPDRSRLDTVDAARFVPDEFAVGAREVYLHCPDGLGRSKLPPAIGTKLAPLTATVRNWNTVTKLAELTGR